jgi:hypothetical protein
LKNIKNDIHFPVSCNFCVFLSTSFCAANAINEVKFETIIFA